MSDLNVRPWWLTPEQMEIAADMLAKAHPEKTLVARSYLRTTAQKIKLTNELRGQHG
jgi:hypothetical protein